MLALCVLGQQAMGGGTHADFVRQAYQDLLGRSPSPGEVTNWEAYLATHTRQETALALDTSQEFYGIVVSDLHGLLLHRPPSPADKNAFALAITGGATIEQVEATIAGGSEYFANRAGSTNTGYIEALFPDLLGRSASPTDVSSFTGLLTSGLTRTDIAAAILGGTEYRTRQVNGYYQDYLRRPPGPSEANVWVTALQSGTRDEVVIAQLVGSSEYFNNIVPVPEPATLAMGALGVMGLLTGRRRRTQAASRIS
jgi:hypothetical protein